MSMQVDPKFKPGEIVQVDYLVGLWSVLQVLMPPLESSRIRYIVVSEDHPRFRREHIGVYGSDGRLVYNSRPAPKFEVDECSMRRWPAISEHDSTLDDLERCVDSFLALTSRLRDFKQHLSHFRQTNRKG